MKRAMMLLAAGCARSPKPPVHAPPPPAVTLTVTEPAQLVEAASSQYLEIRLAARPDGEMLVWGSTDRPGGAGSFDIWVSRKTPSGWSAPASASFNTAAKEFDPAFSPDGTYLYFFSNRPGGAGGDDIYRARVEGDGFGPAEHLGPEINTPGDEWAPTISPDGKRMLFATNKPRAKHDLYIAEVRGDGFAPAALAPGAINTADQDEFDAAFLADGTTIVFSRSPDVDADNYPVELFISALGPNGYGRGEKLSSDVNVGQFTFGPSIDTKDPNVLYISGARPEATRGKMDLYRLRYELKR